MGLTKPELLKLSRIENLFTLIRQHKDTEAIRELAKLLRDAEALGSYKGKAEVMEKIRQKAQEHWDKSIADES